MVTQNQYVWWRLFFINTLTAHLLADLSFESHAKFEWIQMIWTSESSPNRSRKWPRICHCQIWIQENGWEKNERHLFGDDFVYGERLLRLLARLLVSTCFCILGFLFAVIWLFYLVCVQLILLSLGFHILFIPLVLICAFLSILCIFVLYIHE